MVVAHRSDLQKLRGITNVVVKFASSIESQIVYLVVCFNVNKNIKMT